jgi:predicted PurR-regulated permease PerM
VSEGQPVRLAAPSPRAVLRIVLIVVGSAIALYLLWRVRSVIRLAAIGLFLALTMLPLIDALDRRTRLPRSMSILLVYLVLLGFVVVVGAVVVPSMVKEVSQLSHDAPRYARELRGNSTFRHYDDRYHITAKLVQDARRLPQTLGHAVGPLKQVTVSAFGLIGQFITVLALAFLVALRGRDYVNVGLALTGPREKRYRRVLIEVNGAVATYMLGNILISVLVTIVAWITLSILGVPYAVGLGFVMGFFDLIPLVGATLGSIVVALGTTTVHFPVATIVWIVVIVVWQRFENLVIQPLVYGKALHVNPIVTILAVLVGASLLGILGALLAIPTAAAIQIVWSDWWSSRSTAKASSAAADHAAPAQS